MKMTTWWKKSPWHYVESTDVYMSLNLLLGKTKHGQPLRDLPPVFAIGFNKTGTKSLTQLFRDEKIPSVHHDRGALAQKMLNNVRLGKRILNGYDKRYIAFSDFTYLDYETVIEGNEYFREMYLDYPGSFFILNTRPTQNWLESRARHKNGNFMKRYMNILGITDQSEMFEWWSQQKQLHEEAVRKFFEDKPSQFVEIDIEKPDVVEKLKLGLDIDFANDLEHIGKSTSD